MRLSRTRADTSDGRGRSLEHGVWAPFRALLSAQVIAAILGFAFWVVVARLVEPKELGVAAAAISLQTLLGLLTLSLLSLSLASVLAIGFRSSCGIGTLLLS